MFGYWKKTLKINKIKTVPKILVPEREVYDCFADSQ